MAEKITIDREMLEQWMHSVNDYMDLYSAHPFGGLEVGAVLEEATATRGKMLLPQLLLLAALDVVGARGGLRGQGLRGQGRQEGQEGDG